VREGIMKNRFQQEKNPLRPWQPSKPFLDQPRMKLCHEQGVRAGRLVRPGGGEKMAANPR